MIGIRQPHGVEFLQVSDEVVNSLSVEELRARLSVQSTGFFHRPIPFELRSSVEHSQ